MSRPHFDEIDRLYRRILQRGVDPSGYETYSRLMSEDELTEDDLAEILRESDEFRLLAHRTDEPPRFEFRADVRVAGTRGRVVPTRSGPVAATTASRRYIANARVTAASFREHHPDIPFVLLLTDELGDDLNPDDEPFEIWTFDDVRVPDLERFLFHYGELEASYAATPFLVDALLESGFDSVLFLKQETFVLGPLDDLFEALRTRSFLATPHLLDRAEAADDPDRELDVLRAGVFNCGVFGASPAAESRAFLEWWMERTYANCYRLVEDGLHFEQRWLDFLPALVSDLLIVRDPGVNVGHWNLAGRQVRSDGDGFTARGRRLRVFRLSGFDPDDPDHISRYRGDEVGGAGDAEAVFREYHRRLVEAGHHEAQRGDYAFGRFDNGVPIPDVARRIYRDVAPGTARFGDPRRHADADGSFFDWLRRPGPTDGVPALWRAIYDGEPPMRLRFPQVAQLLSDEFAEWWESYRVGRYDIPDELGPTAWSRA